MALLVALWLASKFELARATVAPAARLSVETGLARTAVAAAEVYVVELLDFSPYREW